MTERLGSLVVGVEFYLPSYLALLLFELDPML